MAKIVVNGGQTLSGDVVVSGNKNALLPMMCAALLFQGKTTLSNCPPITDAMKIAEFLTRAGGEVEMDNAQSRILIHGLSRQFTGDVPPFPGGIRSAVLLFAPLVQCLGKVQMSRELGGCKLGLREIDPHLQILKAFGVTVNLCQEELELEMIEPPQGCDYWAPYQSVTATETFLMMAVLAKGQSRIVNAACEPHIQAFAHFLNQAGADIQGIGTNVMMVRGVDMLSSVEFRVPDDHHEMSTFAAIGAATHGQILMRSEASVHLPLIVHSYQHLGLNVRLEDDCVITGASHKKIASTFTPEAMLKLEAAPWPYLPADILPQMIGASIACEGEVMFWNKIYEGALFWTAELSKFGAKTVLADPHRLILMTSPSLRPANVEAPYIIRVVLGLLIAALQIPGSSVINNADPILRAHPNLMTNLQSLGADVEWID